jgi:hypothetical protein
MVSGACPGQDFYRLMCLPNNLIKHLRDSRPTLNWLLIQMMSTDANDLIEA